MSFWFASIFAVFIWWAYGTCLPEKDRIARFETLMKWNFRSDQILEIVTLRLVFYFSGSEERVFWFSSVFDCKSNFFEPHGLSTCTPVQEGRWCLLDLPRLQSLWSLQTIFLNSCSKVGGRRWAWLGRNSGIPVCEVLVVAGLGWACHRWNFGVDLCKAHGLCWACLRLNFRIQDWLPGLWFRQGLPRTKFWSSIL